MCGNVNIWIFVDLDLSKQSFIKVCCEEHIFESICRLIMWFSLLLIELWLFKKLETIKRGNRWHKAREDCLKCIIKRGRVPIKRGSINKARVE